MKINDLKIKSINRGTVVEVWTECYSTDDIDNLIAWLQLAKGVMIKWDKINAKASRAAKEAAGQHEAPQRRKVQGEPQVAARANGQQ